MAVAHAPVFTRAMHSAYESVVTTEIESIGPDEAAAILFLIGDRVERPRWKVAAHEPP
jgi:hypothetical protein